MIDIREQAQGIQKLVIGSRQISPEILTKASDLGNAVNARARGGEITQASIEANELGRKRRDVCEVAALKFVKILNTTALTEKTKFQIIGMDNISDLWQSITDKSLLDRLMTTIKKQNLDLNSETINSLQLCINEPYTVAMRDLHTKFQKKTIEAKVSNNINKSIINRIFGIIKSLMETIVKSFKNGVARLPGRQNPSH